MADNLKENLIPKLPERGAHQDDKATPPFGVRHWQHSALNHSPPLTMLSPNSIPSLARQRDHSACGRMDSPLQVRKQRSHARNLNQAGIFADIPPPCMYAAISQAPDRSPRKPLATTVAQEDTESPVATSGFSVAETSATSSSLSPPATIDQERFVRHKSVSRRVLSKVKGVTDGIVQRSRSHTSIRGTDSEPGIIRRLSGKQKQHFEERHYPKKFEISRDSTCDSSDRGNLNMNSSGSCYSVAEPEETAEQLVTSNLATLRTDREQYPASPKLVDSIRRSPSPDCTPRPPAWQSASHRASGHAVSPFSATVPYIKLQMSKEFYSVDFGQARDIWVAIEATVQSKVVIAGSTVNEILRKRSLDVLLVFCSETLALPSDTNIISQFIIELCSRLDVPGDRLALLVVREQHDEVDGVEYEAAHLFDLKSPQVASVLEHLEIARSTPIDHTSSVNAVHNWMPFSSAWDLLLMQGLRRDCSHSFVVARSPEVLGRALANVSLSPLHLVRIGLSRPPESLLLPACVEWQLDFPTDTEVRSELLDNLIQDVRHNCSMGTIPSFRICYKAMNNCRIAEVVGHKTAKDLRLGQRCTLFLKVHVPKLDRPTSIPDLEMDVNTLMRELEGIVGTLQMEFLHIEVRYRHTILPTDNHIVSIREICTVRRPKTDSRWSGVWDSGTSLDVDTMPPVRSSLALFLKVNYAPSVATELMNSWALADTSSIPTVEQQCDPSRDVHPAVVITDTDELETPTRSATYSPVIVPPRTISAPRITTAISTSPAESQSEKERSKEDSARQLWRHIRRSSLSAAQLLEVSPKHVQQLEASDDNLRMLRHKALLNKRSVGAETLRAWKWDETVTGGETPWL